MTMNPIRVTYAAAATGVQTALSIDWRDVPSGCSYEVQFNSGASGTIVVESTLDDINDPSITPDWIAESGSLTADTRGVIGHPVQAIRLNITGALSGGSVTFKVLVGAPAGDVSGVVPSGGGAPSSNVNLAQVGGAAITEGQKTSAASIPTVLASDYFPAAYTYSRKTADGQVKGSAGAIHTVSFSPIGSVTAGVITIYDSLTETGTVILSVSLPVTTFTPFSVLLDVAATTGIFVGYDGTVANVQTTVSYR